VNRGKLRSARTAPASYREKRAAPATGLPHLRGSKKTFRSTTNALMMADADAEGPFGERSSVRANEQIM